MKKKVVLGLFKMMTVVMLCAGTLTGCAGEKPGAGTESGQVQESQVAEAEAVNRILLKDIDLSQYVKMGDYSSLRVSKVEFEVTDEEVESAMQEEYLNRFPSEMHSLEKAIELDDIANIDFVGKVDGVAFEGGTAKGYELTIGSHKFISGFEEGLVGVTPGETVDLNLKFPEDYRTEDLAGKDVVFTVTVNYVIPTKIDEAVVAKLGIENVSTIEEFRKYIYDDIYQQKESYYAQSYENEIFSEFMALCEFQELPSDLIESTRAVITQALTASASQYGLDADTFVYYVYQTDLNTFLDYYTVPSLRQNMALYLVAQQENLIPDDEELMKVIGEYMQETGFDDMTEYMEAVGSSFDEFREDYSVTKAYDRVLEIAMQ